MAKKFGEFIAYLLIAAAATTFVALSVAITFWVLTWAFGGR